MTNERWVTVFGSARTRPGEPLWADAAAVGRAIAEAGFGLVNGGYGGTMTASAEAARAAGAATRGITLAVFGRGNPHLDREETAPSLFARIERLIETASAVVVLPGGTGTLLELAAVLELSSKSFLDRPIPIFLVVYFFLPVIDTVLPELRANRDAPLAGRPRSTTLDQLRFVADAAELAAALRAVAAT